ncbi:hypothetical protein FUAX_54870 (plasmid) [Fulvitalea axinellae]|uniref:Initiator Rep protein WH1 domain-containing protein n=1 Tax=Fulvitalea axinellae TaxID=1182444 RepID=A0AAU9CVI7_9BACT|nr:hypothetical protein FUAX_54870 [Fulvitalea axinellae]
MIKEDTEVGEYRVTKSNKILPRKKEPFTLIQQRAIAIAISQIRIEDTELKPQKVEMRRVLGLGPEESMSGAQYTRTRESLMQLTRTSIEYVRDPNDPGSAFRSVNFISEVNREENSAYVTIHFAPAVKDFLLGLRSNFTSYSLKYVYDFRSTSSLIVYELCKQYERKGKRIVSLDLFRKYTVVEDKYPKFSQLRKWVIEPALRDINELSDIRVELETKRKGRAVNTLIFHIRPAAGSRPSIAEEAERPKPKRKAKPVAVAEPEPVVLEPAEAMEAPVWDVDLPEGEKASEEALERAKDAYGEYYERSRTEWLRKITREDKVAFAEYAQDPETEGHWRDLLAKLKAGPDMADWKRFAGFVIMRRGNERERRWLDMDLYLEDWLTEEREPALEDIVGQLVGDF